MKDILVRIVLIIVLLALYVTMNSGVSDLLVQQEGMGIALKQGRSLWVGLGRWLSHINWMLLLQKRASIFGQPDPAVAGALYKRYNTTTDQDPYLVMAYEHGGVELATIGKPELGLDLLDKGIDVVGDKNWKLPSYAAQIVTQYCKDDDQAEAKARQYWLKAKQVDGHPFYIESALVRIQSKGLKDDPVKMAELWKQVGSRTGSDRDTAQRDVMASESDFGEYGDRYSKQTCDKVVGILRKVRSDAAKATDPAQKKKLNDQAKQITKIIKAMMGSQHACNYCFAEYQAGDKFCPNCGRTVEVFGVCTKCGSVLEPNAKFCSHCGTKAPKPKVRKPKPIKSPKPKAGK